MNYSMKEKLTTVLKLQKFIYNNTRSALIKKKNNFTTICKMTWQLSVILLILT